MSRPWRLLDLGVTDPYATEAIGEVLSKARRMNVIPNTLCVRMPERYVGVVGTGLRRVNMDYCHKKKIPIVREMGIVGGSAYVFDEDALYIDFISEPILQGFRPNFELFMNGIIKSLQYMDLEAHIKPNANDVLIKGRKISGGGGRIHYDLFHANCGLMLNFNYDFCEKAIPSRPELFTNKEAKSHREWVTTLNAELGREVSFSEMISALKRGFESVLEVEFEVSTSLTEAEDQILEDLLVKYRSEEWLNRGRWSPVKDYWRQK